MKCAHLVFKARALRRVLVVVFVSSCRRVVKTITHQSHALRSAIVTLLAGCALCDDTSASLYNCICN